MRGSRVLAAGFALGLVVTLIPAPAYASTQVVFAFTGADQTWTVPTGVTSVQVTILGAGGGGGRASAGSVAFGGGGGAVTGSLTVTPGDVLTIIVGEGGINDNVSSPRNNNYRFGGGGSGAGNAASFPDSWGSGGGRSAIRSSAAIYATTGDVLTAGAGGGGGYNVSLGEGGAGGGLTGVTGGRGDTTTGGGGGTQVAGGAGGGPLEPGTAGIAYAGGFAELAGGSSESGGGGGGYYGGGAAGNNGGGGGGSSYLGSATYFTGTTTSGTGREPALSDLPAACGTNPGRGAPPGKSSLAGVGIGGHGCVVITITAPEIATTASITAGDRDPSITITTTSTFAAGVTTASFTFGAGATGLTLASVTRTSGTEVILNFTGTTAMGSLSITALAAAFDPVTLNSSNTLTVIVIPAAIIEAEPNQISLEQSAPTLVITSASTFDAGVAASDFVVSVGSTGLVVNTVTRTSTTSVTFTFTGTALVGRLTVQALASAFDPVTASDSNTLVFNVRIDNTMSPPPWLLAYERANATAVCQSGWNPSWAEWPNGGTGGFTCERRYQFIEDRWVEIPGFPQ